MIKNILLLVSLSILSLSLPLISNAAEGQPYSVKTILPPEQDIGINNYVSISTDKYSYKQDIEYLVTNKTNKSIEIHITPLNALTSANGVIDYSINIKEENAMLIDEKYSMPQYIEVIDKITLDAYESKVVKAAVDISGVEGTILGGIGFQVFEEGDMKEEDNVQFRINNEMNTIIGLLVKFNSDEKAAFEIGDPFVSPLPSYYAIRLPITLNSAILARNVSLNYQVLTAEREKLFHSIEDRIFTFGPETKSNVSLPWENEEIKAGKTYILKGTLIYKDDIIEFEKEFKFDKDASISNNDEFNTPTIVEDGFSWWWILLFVSLLGLLIIMARKKKKKEEGGGPIE